MCISYYVQSSLGLIGEGPLRRGEVPPRNIEPAITLAPTPPPNRARLKWIESREIFGNLEKSLEI